MVIIYFSRLGAPLQVREKSTLMAVGRAIAEIKGCAFGGCYRGLNDRGSTFFVPDDSLVTDEAACLGISRPHDLSGGVVPYPFVKTKAITHGLIDTHAARPAGWSSEFAARIRDAVLPGFTVFSHNERRTAAGRLLAAGPVRAKPPLATGGRAQRVLATIAEVDALLDGLEPERLGSYGLVLEPDVRRLKTLSIGRIVLGVVTLTYNGTQKAVTDNEGRSVYGGSDLVCMRGDWDALDGLPLDRNMRTALAQAKTYDDAMAEYPGFFASRRNYDIGQGLDAAGHWRSGVFEASWRVGGASIAELAALADLQRDPALQTIEVKAVKEFGSGQHPPPGAIVHFCGDDPEAGPVLRYTVVTRKDPGKPGQRQRTLAK